jgi:hypothetical protein
MTRSAIGKSASWRPRAVIALATTAGLLSIPSLAHATARPPITAARNHRLHLYHPRRRI